jgi:hypothetical protein
MVFDGIVTYRYLATQGPVGAVIPTIQCHENKTFGPHYTFQTLFLYLLFCL